MFLGFAQGAATSDRFYAGFGFVRQKFSDRHRNKKNCSGTIAPILIGRLNSLGAFSLHRIADGARC
jgi:hypothetical protein